MASVPIEHRVARAGALHDLDPFDEDEPGGPRIWVCDVSRPALVLGSRQVPETADRDACTAAGIEVVRRRSGGGAVLLRPGAQIWLDVVIPVEVVAPRGPVPDDVRGSMVWIGECWHEALIDLGADPDRVVTHRGAMVHTPWSDLVCFAGVGPGELLVGDGPGERVVGDGPGERVVGDGPGVVGDGPGVGVGPGERVVGDGPGVVGDGPGVGVGPGERVVGDGPGERVVGDGPGVVGDGPGERVVGDGPGVVGDGPGVGVGPGERVVGDGPGVVGDGPGVGVGPGERVVGNGPKLLGLSQRRTRDGLRVQCQVYREPVTTELPRLLAVATPEVALAEPATLGDVVPPGADDNTTTATDGMVADAVAAAVRRRLTAE